MIAVAPASSRIGQRQSLAGDGDHAFIALFAASPTEGLALCQAQALPEGDAPEWVQLVPPGPVVATIDSRGPYQLVDAAALAAASLKPGERLPIDENHATDLAGPRGEPSPARGWIVALEARPEGIFGRVDWTQSGKALMADRAYRFISPVIVHDKDKRLLKLLRASLVNNPNLRGMAALHAEEKTMNPVLAAILKKLGLKDDADETTALNAIEALATSASATALQAATAPIATAAGLKDDADQAAIVAAVTTLATAGGDAKTVASLQAELTTTATALKTLQDTVARDRATAAVDAAIEAGKPGVSALRDHYITRHMANATEVEAEFAKMPSLKTASGARAAPPAAKGKDGNVVVALNAETAAVARMLGNDPEKVKAVLAAEAADADTVAA